MWGGDVLLQLKRDSYHLGCQALCQHFACIILLTILRILQGRKWRHGDGSQLLYSFARTAGPRSPKQRDFDDVFLLLPLGGCRLETLLENKELSVLLQMRKVRHGDHRKNSNETRTQMVLVLVLLLTTSLQTWANFSTSLSFPFFGYNIRIMLILFNISHWRLLETPPFLVELVGFIAHCSKEQESPWKTIQCIKRSQKDLLVDGPCQVILVRVSSALGGQCQEVGCSSHWIP